MPLAVKRAKANAPLELPARTIEPSGPIAKLYAMSSEEPTGSRRQPGGAEMVVDVSVGSKSPGRRTGLGVGAGDQDPPLGVEADGIGGIVLAGGAGDDLAVVAGR